MTVNVERESGLVIFAISGRLDSTTSPNLEKIIGKLSEDTDELVFDMTELEYISSAGVRVLLGAHRKMNLNHGIMRIRKTNDVVRRVFEMIGLSQMFLKE